MQGKTVNYVRTCSVPDPIPHANAWADRGKGAG